MNAPDWIEQLAAGAIHPQRVRRSLERITAVWPEGATAAAELIRGLPEGGAALGHLLSVSPISAEKIVADPDALCWLVRPDVALSERGPRRMRGALDALHGAERTEAFDESFRVLRRWKQREMLRIALREVAGWSSVEQTTLELAHLAELCVRTVVDSWLAELARRWGRPETDFAVLGMGKFGGQELNYSSDIDLIFFYGEEGSLNPRFSYQEFFARLAEKIIATFSAANPAGPLFRIDLRLRPEGSSGPLVRSLDSTETYYSGHGETWERMALIKARLVAGGEELGYEFTQRMQPFVFPRTVSLDVMEEIAAIKRRIEREIVGQSSLRRNVKLGYGGIREIEFVAQTLQIVHGARHAFLQERNTLRTLRALQQLDIIPTAQMETLIEAYCFLRRVEHRLQIENEAQTHTLPDDAEALDRLAKSLGFARTTALQAELARQTGAVREIFEHILRVPPDAPPAPARDVSIFRDAEQARKGLAELDGSAATARFSPRTKKLAGKLEPLLLDRLREIADPDAALTRFLHFVERYGARGLLFETLLRNPRVLELLVKLFDASRFMTEIVLRRPQLIEEVARSGGLGETLDVADYLAGLARNEERLAWSDWVRAYRRAQLLRIGLRDVLAFATLRELQCEYSALAEACLAFTQQQLGLTDELTIVAMGKFGGCELGYGADLDVIFIGENSRGAAEIIRAMSTMTAEGRVFQVDARLRPEGESAPLACSLASFAAYFEKRAQLWEAQSLTKARAISGPQKDEYAEVARTIWRRFGARADLSEQIAAMHARIVKERAGADEMREFKTGRGGLMQLEFFTQGRQMRAGIWEQNTINALAAFAAANVIPSDEAGRLTASYSFLRRCESVLRRVEDTSVSALPRAAVEQRQLAIRCGFATQDEFFADFQNARETIRDLARL